MTFELEPIPFSLFACDYRFYCHFFLGFIFQWRMARVYMSRNQLMKLKWWYLYSIFIQYNVYYYYDFEFHCLFNFYIPNKVQNGSDKRRVKKYSVSEKINFKLQSLQRRNRWSKCEIFPFDFSFKFQNFINRIFEY